MEGTCRLSEGAAKQYAFSVKTGIEQNMVYLHDVDEYPVADEPDEDVDEEDGDGVPPEEEGRRPRRHHAQQHALRDGLEEYRHRRRRRVQLPPPESQREVCGISTYKIKHVQ